MKVKRVMIMAGGTGGHVFPALAIAEKLKSQQVEVEWLGTRGRMEEMLVPKYGYNIHYIDVKGVRRNGLKTMLKAPFMIVKAVLQAKKILREFKPDLVIGMGGYASGPGGFAAYLMKIPLLVHEQNAAAGLTNKLLFKLADTVMLGFPGAFEGKKVKVVGNPVRDSIRILHEQERAYNTLPLRITIVGGSLGAQALNNIVPLGLKKFTDNNVISVVHQCGKGNSSKVLPLYEGASFEYQVCDFIDDMQSLYKNTDLIICRAGALTVAETACAGVPAIFIPLPTAVDDHQTKNASFLRDIGAAYIIPQSELTAESLYAKIAPLVKDMEILGNMSALLKKNAITDATDKVMEVIEGL